ncbi:MAG: hypothetical protein JWQ63_3613 [Mucilaginibacter sp.]|nr:hypothetical protein [Mucilaginibacter sp.]
MEILIFKTNVTSKKKASKVGTLLSSVQTIKQWNFDLEDCDKVLRIVATELKPSWVETLLQTAGFTCQVLDY